MDVLTLLNNPCLCKREIFLNFKFDTSKLCLNSINRTPKEIKQTLEKENDIDPTLFKSVNSGTRFELKPCIETIVFNNYKWSFTSSKMECSSTWKNSCRIQSIRFTHVSCHVNQCLGFILDIGSTNLVFLDIKPPALDV